MKNILESIQNRLAEIKELHYIDEDWGQIDYYNPNMPVKWPIALIDITDAEYSDIGRDFNNTPHNRQQAPIAISITIANLKLTNTSYKAPQKQKDVAWSIWGVIQSIHEALHGWSPKENTNKLIRKSFKRIKRDDGIQEYNVVYTSMIQNV